MKRDRVNWLATLLLLVCCPALHAAPPEPCTEAFQAKVATQGGDSFPASSVYAVFIQERGHCILGPDDTTGVEQLLETLRNTKTSDADRAAARQSLFKLARAEFDNFPTAPCNGNSIECGAGRQVARIDDLQKMLMTGPPDPHSVLLAQSGWAVVPETHTIQVSDIDLLALLTAGCMPGATSKECIRAVDFAARVVRTSDAMHEVVNAYLQPVIDTNTKFLTLRDKEWNSYMNDVSVQYPWELWLNGLVFQKTISPQDRPQFPMAPTSKWVFLHPSPGFERVAGSSGRHSTQAAIFMEFLGYERWRWSDGSASGRWGASLIASFVDATGVSAVGYGLLVKTPLQNVSIGVVWRNTDRGRQVNLAVNVDLAKLTQKYKDIDVKKFIGGVSQGQN